MNALLDTSVIIDGIPEEVETASISVVTIAELRFGVERAANDLERQRRTVWFGAVHELFTPIPVDTAVAHAWGGLADLAVRRRLQPRRRAMDLLIAATAQVHGLVLLTRDDDLMWLADVLDVRGV